MSQETLTPEITNLPLSETDWEEMPEPDISNIITEDNTPVDNLISEKQQRLLTVCLYSSLKRDIPFLATANVALFYGAKQPPLVPDVLLSFGIIVPDDWSQKKNRSYFTWNFGKPPEVAIEIVSNKIGNELDSKLTNYAHAAVAYYVVFDPLYCLGERILYVHELRGMRYHLLDNYWMENIELGLIFWQGKFENKEYSWLRWCDKSSNILLTGDEIAEQERQRAEYEKQRAEQEKQRADRLAEILRSQGVNPDQI